MPSSDERDSRHAAIRAMDAEGVKWIGAGIAPQFIGPYMLDALIALGWQSPAEVQQLREERDRWVHDFAVLAEANASNSADRIAAEAERDRYAAVIEKVLRVASRGHVPDDVFEALSRLLASVDSGSALAEVKAQTLDGTAAKIIGATKPDSLGIRETERVDPYGNASVWLYTRAEQIRKEGK